ncbi:DUF5961 family protein [Phenylobacterium sp.]|uniref:DUF5961 family protein n=1 Tax=Phenylobacterium sp. TaxID=1871053 RepID=UPI0012124764|nr:DUF5961 family protein [Phenylobacterium sp.]THD59337.1 MAG: hypothetical protein E8A49_16745 [Phenylobacterium sp.]
MIVLPPQRRFSVHGVEDAPGRSLLIEGCNFEDAALSFVEHQHLESHRGDPDRDDTVSLLVEDCDTGERQCFRIDLATGEAAPCD